MTSKLATALLMAISCFAQSAQQVAIQAVDAKYRKQLRKAEDRTRKDRADYFRVRAEWSAACESFGMMLASDDFASGACRDKPQQPIAPPVPIPPPGTRK